MFYAPRPYFFARLLPKAQKFLGVMDSGQTNYLHPIPKRPMPRRRRPMLFVRWKAQRSSLRPTYTQTNQRSRCRLLYSV